MSDGDSNETVRVSDELGNADGKADVGGTNPQAPQKEPQETSTVIRWMVTHPRRALVILILALVPYLLLCWAMTLFVVMAMFKGGCG